MSTRRLIRQEIKASQEFLVGTTLIDPHYIIFDTVNNPVWVTVVEISSTRVLHNVPVKTGSDGSRVYARAGATVLLRRNARGRFEVVGPGDRKTAPMVRKRYTYGVPTPTETASIGFTVRRLPFDYYRGLGPGTVLWGDNSTPFPARALYDADNTFIQYI